MGALLIVTYASIAVFVIAVLVRFVTLSRLPIHLRWELYPVAHESRAHYGGSYLEEPEWWTKPRQTSHVGELKVMVPEILLLAGVWEHNRKHWFRTFPFHFGLYLLGGLVGLLAIGGIATAAGATVAPGGGWAAALLHHATYLVGYAGLGLGLIGALALLSRRAFDPDYAEFTKKGDYFNLAFFVATLGVALVAHVLVDPTFAGLRAFAARLVTFDVSGAGASVHALPAAEIVLGSLLLAYIPLTHMSHFFTKWFMYHHIRWSDEPNLPGGALERRLQDVMQYPVTWSAPHIRGDGKRNWVDVATSPVKEKQG
jgi:nitrate reductase gamma subunit